MKTYAIGDLHGNYAVFEKVLEEITTHSDGEPCKLVVLGDFVDRGPESAKIVKTLREGHCNNIEFVVIQGNHEDMMVQVCEKTSFENLNWWIGNGGGSTLYSYGLGSDDLWARQAGSCDEQCSVLDDDLEWLAQLPVTYQDDHRIYVHAGVHPERSLEETSKEYHQWVLSDTGSSFPNPTGKHVVHGHMQYEFGPILLTHRSNFDTFAWKTNKQGIGVFDDDLPGGPVEILWGDAGVSDPE